MSCGLVGITSGLGRISSPFFRFFNEVLPFAGAAGTASDGTTGIMSSSIVGSFGTDASGTAVGGGECDVNEDGGDMAGASTDVISTEGERARSGDGDGDGESSGGDIGGSTKWNIRVAICI